MGMMGIPPAREQQNIPIIPIIPNPFGVFKKTPSLWIINKLAGYDRWA